MKPCTIVVTMKAFILLVLILTCGAAQAADRKVMVLAFPDVADGGVVQPPHDVQFKGREGYLLLLFIDEPCSIEFDGAAQAHRAWEAPGRIECWLAAANGQVILVDQQGRARLNDSYWAAYPHGILHADGTVTIKDPDYKPGDIWLRSRQLAAQNAAPQFARP